LEGFSSQFLFVSVFCLLEDLLILLLLIVLNPNSSHPLHPWVFISLLSQSFFSGLITPMLFSLLNKGIPYVFPQGRTGLSERGRM